MYKHLKQGINNLIQNRLTAVPAILVIAILLTLFHGLLSVYIRAEKTLNTVQEKFSITLYLRDDADAFEIGNLITKLEERRDVKTPVIYTSKESAWKLMSSAFSLDSELLKKYQFSLPASLTITPISPENAAEIEEFAKTSAGQLLKENSPAKNSEQNLTSQMLSFIQNVKDATLRSLIFFIFLFVIGGSLLLGGTIHLAITARHKEISIMKLVGASRAHITAPFIAEGFVISIAAFLLHLFLQLILPLNSFTNSTQLNALLLEFVAVTLLGVLTSYATTLFHMRKKLLI